MQTKASILKGRYRGHVERLSMSSLNRAMLVEAGSSGHVFGGAFLGCF